MKSSAVALLLLLTTLSSMKPFMHVKNNRIYDYAGGERIFHGLNVVKKEPSYDDPGFGQKQLKQFKKDGINGIRLGVMWPGVEPKENQFNQTYLKGMVDFVNLAGKYNVYTLVEFHQDLFSQKFCADGVPMWAIPKQIYQSFPIPLQKHKIDFDPSGYPKAQACKTKRDWSEIYFTKAVNKAFGSLWKNKFGLLDKFARYWRKVTQAFKGNPYVIAFELINEPWPGNLYEDPLVMVPGLSQKVHLQRAYDFLSAEIRKIDPDRNICFEPVTWLNNFESGFVSPPGGKRFSNSSMLCYHYYNPPTLNLDKFMNARVKDVKRLNVGAILSEMFVIDDQGRKNIEMMDKCDQHSHSWFGWIYLPGRMIKEIKRTFTHRVAGTIVSQSFKNSTREYQLLYHANKHAGQTIIYFDPTQHYAGGVNVNIYPRLDRVQYHIVDEVYIAIDSSQFEDGAVVMVVITP